MSDKLTFGELIIGDTFISFPAAGDDAGHGGFKGGHVLLKKIKPIKTQAAFSGSNAMRGNGLLSKIPDSMEVIKIV